MGEEGYIPPDTQEGFKEPYEDFGQLSTASSTGHSGASTSRFLTNVHKTLTVLIKGFVDQGSKVVQTNLPELRLQRKELDKAANNA